MKTLLCILVCCVFWQYAYAVVNVAIGGSAVQSSSESNSRGPEQAIDGNTDNDPLTGTCSSTSCSDTDPYWIVCLGDTYEISAVNIVTPNTTSHAFQNLRIEVFSTDPRISTATGTECGIIGNTPVPPGATVPVSCNSTIQGKYVKITTIPQPPSWSPWGHHYHNRGNSHHGWNTQCERLYLCEVEVEALPICQTGFFRNNDSCYHIATVHTLSWIEAMSFCRSLGADLAILDSAEENDFIRGYLLSLDAALFFDHYYIGFSRIRDYPNFEWLDDSAVPITTFDNWGGSDPQTVEYCGALQTHSMYKWVDFYCNRRERFICEYNAQWPRITKNDCYCDSARRTPKQI